MAINHDPRCKQCRREGVKLYLKGDKCYTKCTLDRSKDGKTMWRMRFPGLAPAYLSSLREVLNHTWYALRGGYVREAFLRLFYFKWNSFVMLLPRYTVGYGRIVSLLYEGDKVLAEIQPASKYGEALAATALHYTVESHF